MELVKNFVVSAMMDLIKKDLDLLGVNYDVFFSEQTLHQQNKITEVVNFLQEKGLVYRGVLNPPKGKLPEDWEEREQLLFRTTEFGDDIDRPLQKSNGDWTYMAADLAYMKNKIDRGFKKITMVLGADHLGYKKRMQAAAYALGGEAIDFEIKFYQVVNFFQNGKPYKMSKRKGVFISVEDVLEEVNKDLVRFVMLTRKNDQILDFDFEKVKEQSKDNPVFYVQYANARVNSILSNAQEQNPKYLERIALGDYDLSLLDNAEDIELIKYMASWPKMVELACIHQEPHRIAFFLIDLASRFHGFWSKGSDNSELRFIIANNVEKTLARLVLAKAVSIVISSGLRIFNISPIEKM
jgi:arginyl-tRNA synthetase